MSKVAQDDSYMVKFKANSIKVQKFSVSWPASRLVFPALAVMLPVGNFCYAAGSTQSLAQLESSVAVQQDKLNQEELQLEQQSLELDRQQRLIESEMRNLRGRGDTSQTTAAAVVPSASAAPGTEQPTQTSDGTVGAEQQQQQQQSRQEATKIIIQSSTVLSNAGGVLTPKGQIVVDPSLEYDYWDQNQLQLNGFTILPGITFGNIFISRVEQNFLTAAVTTRYGLTDRLELNMKIPFVAGYGTTTTQAVGANAVRLSPSATNANIGDLQFGASYQFNSGNNGWPVFVGNLLFKTITGVSPYDVPIYTVNDTKYGANSGQFLEGIAKRLPTGTGFYALEPSVTIFYPTDPGVIFGNFQYIYNFGNTFNIPSPTGGSALREKLQPGDAVAATFGVGFAINDKTSFNLSYQHEHVFGSSVGGVSLPGSSYDFGTFNFGVGYAFNARTSLNIGVGIGVGPDAPAAKVLVEVPIRFNAF